MAKETMTLKDTERCATAAIMAEESFSCSQKKPLNGKQVKAVFKEYVLAYSKVVDILETLDSKSTKALTEQDKDTLSAFTMQREYVLDMLIMAGKIPKGTPKDFIKPSEIWDTPKDMMKDVRDIILEANKNTKMDCQTRKACLKAYSSVAVTLYMCYKYIK